MAEKSFTWTTKLAKKMFELRFQNDILFQSKKQPWVDFHSILLENGFPKEMTINHLRKKWSYTYDSYKIAKRDKNKKWIYYKIFNKHYGKNSVLDKYESWNDEWRLKLIACIMEAKELKLNYLDMWKTVETAMRSQDLPLGCCVQDMKGLFEHIKVTFRRKHRLKLKHNWKESEWPLYDVMLEYCQKYDAMSLLPDSDVFDESDHRNKRNVAMSAINKDDKEASNFNWTKDITESFIQMRLQNDYLFRTRKQPWSDFLEIVIDQCGFPRTLTSRDLSSKWAATYADYQKAIATNYRSWIYYNIFELYLGDGALSLNPTVGWPDEWILSLIQMRMELEELFSRHPKDQPKCWREVEIKLRILGIPMECSLFDLPEIWTHLVREYKWKRKFAKKGLLNETWPFYDAMARYYQVSPKKQNRANKIESEYEDYNNGDDDNEDDMKLFDLKQRMQVKDEKPVEVDLACVCRTCNSDEGCVSVFGNKDDDEHDVADKLRIICGLEVDETENLPSRICVNCFRELECAFKFRKKCIKAEQELKELNASRQIKIEVKTDDQTNDDVGNDFRDSIFDDHITHDLNSDLDIKTMLRKPLKKERKKTFLTKKEREKRKRAQDYKYTKMCEICGKHSRHLAAHLDAHASEKAYSCDICGKKFKFKSAVILHKAVHNPEPKKTCEICGKTFHIMAYYRKHFAYHANERKFECDVCPKKFNSRDVLRIHKLIHSGERNFHCSDCGKTFRTAGCVRRHKRIVHKKIVEGQ